MMSQVTDQDGVWEITEGNGCINKRLIQSSVEYLATHPVTVQPPSDEERLSALESAIADMMGV